MLYSPFSSPRRLVLLAVFVFFALIVLLRNSRYSDFQRPQTEPTSYKFSDSQDYAEDLTVEEPEVGDDIEVSPNKPVHEDPATVKSRPKVKTTYSETAAAPTLVRPPKHEPSVPVVVDYSHADVTPVKHIDYYDLQAKIKELINWRPLNTEKHWPAWNGYRDSEYDPNRWEGFEWDTGYYTENGVKRFQQQTGLKPEPYLPYPDYNTDSWKRKWQGEYVACEGARGRNLNESIEDMVHAYRGMPADFPNVTVGTADVVGLDEDICFDRYHRYGPYGFGQGNINSAEGWSRPNERPDWSSIWWGQLQDACLERNKHRYAPEARAPMNLVPTMELPASADSYKLTEPVDAPEPKYHSRTAVLIRTWEGYSYTENDLQAIRALVTELSLLTGGEYQVYLFVNVKELEADIYGDPQVYQDILRKVVPRELRDISLLWTEKVCESMYPKVGDWQVYWQQFMPLQWFAKTHPEFDYVWNWETDARYTGNHYHFLEKISQFAKTMPRKNLWERNSRFYFPDAHGNYASFLADTDKTVQQAIENRNLTTVWGAMPYKEEQETIGPVPPRRYEEDVFDWGVDEEADLITLQPIWDPTKTEWSYRYKIWNFVEGKVPVFAPEDPGDDAYYHPDFAKVPRRTFINTVARFSKKMLHAMHMENKAGRSMQAEMWPATVALQHGLKAVYAPHPIWADRKWPAWFLDATFNADGGDTAAWGQRFDSPYNHDREAAFRGWSWYYATGFPRVLYRRWLGWSSEDILGNVGGDKFENEVTKTEEHGDVGGHGRMCLPGMLLHPVKKVKEEDGVWAAFRSPDPADVENERKLTKQVEELMT